MQIGIEIEVIEVKPESLPDVTEREYEPDEIEREHEGDAVERERYADPVPA